MTIRELFSHKLEHAEVAPSGSVRADLMQSVARREFIRFNPSRFNIYYLGGIVAAAVAAAILITSHQVPVKKSYIIAPSVEKVRNNSVAYDSIINRQTEKLMAAHKNGNLNNKDSGSESGKNHASGLPSVVNKTEGKTGDILNRGNHDHLEKKAVIKDNLSENSNQILLQKKAEAVFEVSTSDGCPPLKIRFQNRSIAFDSCRWVFGDGGSSTERDPEWIFDIEGEYRVILKVFGAKGNEASTSYAIKVHPKPVARFEINPPNPIIPDDEIRFLNYSADAVRYRWEFGDGNISESFEPDHKYEKYKNYDVRLIAWSAYECSDSMTVINAFSKSGCYIDFPNAFIPNPNGPAGGYYSSKSDEAAQIFHPVTSGVSDFQMRIFSKKGILIFESNDINIGWDGYLKGQLCDPGVYIWKVRGTYKNGEPFVKMGDVTLLKK